MRRKHKHQRQVGEPRPDTHPQRHLRSIERIHRDERAEDNPGDGPDELLSLALFQLKTWCNLNSEPVSRLKEIALGVVLFVVVIAALKFIVLAPVMKRAKAGICESHFKAIIAASKNYAREHVTGYQTNLICLSNHLISPAILLCVEDEVRRRRVRDKESPLKGPWARVTMDDCSYEVFLRDSNTLVLRCPFHRIGMRTVGEIKDEWTNYAHERK